MVEKGPSFPRVNSPFPGPSLGLFTCSLMVSGPGPSLIQEGDFQEPPPIFRSPPRSPGCTPGHATAQRARPVHSAAAAGPAGAGSEGNMAVGPGFLLKHTCSVSNTPCACQWLAFQLVGHLTVSLVLNMGPGMLQVRRTQEVAQSGKERRDLTGEQSGLSPQLPHAKTCKKTHIHTYTHHTITVHTRRQCTHAETYTRGGAHTQTHHTALGADTETYTQRHARTEKRVHTLLCLG